MFGYLFTSLISEILFTSNYSNNPLINSKCRLKIFIAKVNRMHPITSTAMFTTSQWDNFVCLMPYVCGKCHVKMEDGEKKQVGGSFHCSTLSSASDKDDLIQQLNTLNSNSGYISRTSFVYVCLTYFWNVNICKLLLFLKNVVHATYVVYCLEQSPW